MDKRMAEIVMSTVLIGVSLVILLNDNLVEGGLETDLGSMFLPRIVAGLISVFSLAIAFPAARSLSQRKVATEEEQIDVQGFSGILMYMGTLVAYWLVLPHLGFVLSTLLVIFFVAFIFDCKGIRSWLNVAVLSLIITFGLDYGTREHLRVYLPSFDLF